MIRYFAFVYFLMFILSSFTLQDLSAERKSSRMQVYDSSLPNEQLEKIYLDPENVVIEQKSLYVIIEDRMIPVSQINADEHGIYYTVDCYQPNGTWMCPRCGYTNTWFDSECYYCSWPNPE